MPWTWSNTSGDNTFNNANNWTVTGNDVAGTVPSTNNDGTIDIPAGASIIMGSNETLQTINIIGAGTAQLTGAYTLTVNTINLTDGQTMAFGASTVVDVKQQVVMSGNGTATLSGGIIEISAAMTLSATQKLVITNGAAVQLDSQITGGGTITLNGGTLTALNNIPQVTIDFAKVTGGLVNTLNISDWMSGISITNFSYGDYIQANGDTLELVLNSDGMTYSLVDTHGGNYTSTISTEISLSSAVGTARPSTIPLTNSSGGNYYPCFYPGTMLATKDGEIAVEDLTIGTLLKTGSGALLPVRWVGWSQVAMRFADPLRTLPIRIKAGALADGVPVRDLLVSPDHAVFVDDVLVQAGALVNGTSIIREEDVPENFRYYHVEFATHELLVAEGCPAESFVDNIDRMNFHNWDAREAPAEPVVEMEYPRARSSRQVPASIRSAIAARAAGLVEACAA